MHCFHLGKYHTTEVSIVLSSSWRANAKVSSAGELLVGVCGSEVFFPLAALQLSRREAIQARTPVSSFFSLSLYCDIRNPQSRMNEAHLHLKLVKKSKCQDVFYSLATLVYANCTPLFRRYGMSGLIFLIVTLSRND